MAFLFDLPQPSLPVAGRQACFPVGRIWCVGQNYTDHVKEMGGTGREAPIFFSKSADAILPGGGRLPMPPRTSDLHHEVELVVAVGRDGRDLPVDHALDAVLGYAVGLDLTRRDLQRELRAKGSPWELSKTFDGAAPIGPLHLATDVGHPSSGAIWLDVNGVRRQEGNLRDLVWSVPEILAYLSTYHTLRPGDLVFTGTPAGVGTLHPGDHIQCGIDGLGTLDLTLA